MTRPGVAWLIVFWLGGGLSSSMASAQSPPDNELTLELLQRIEQLESEVRYLRGELEVQRHWLERLAQNQATATPSVPAPPPATAAASTDTQPASTPAESSRSVSSAPTSPAAASATTASDPVGAEAADYDAALDALREGRYPVAIKAWQHFLQTHPNSARAGEAHYWLGEAYYLNRNQAAAQETFINLGLQHPQSTRLPDALLKLGYLYSEQGEAEQARTVLEKLVKVYPETPAASLAKRRLESLR